MPGRKAVGPLSVRADWKSSLQMEFCSVQCGCFPSWLLLVLKLIKFRMSEAGQTLRANHVGKLSEFLW